jgi:hypothetical protein
MKAHKASIESAQYKAWQYFLNKWIIK